LCALCAAGVLGLEHQQALDQPRSLDARPPGGEHRLLGPVFAAVHAAAAVGHG
jgi:hypothetical protein